MPTISDQLSIAVRPQSDAYPQGPLEFAQNQVYDIKGILGYISISMVYEWYIMIKCDEY